MLESSELLRSYAEGIRRLSGAGSVALFVPPSLSGFSRSILLHDGPLGPVAELADLETAQSFADGGRPDPAAEAIPSATPGGGLIPLPAVHSAWALAVLPEQLVGGPSFPGRRRSDDDPPMPSAWLGLRFADEEDSVPERLSQLDLRAALTDETERPNWWRWLFAMGGALASHTAQVSAILKDPITGLPDRAGFQAVLSEELEKARLRQAPLSLILVNPDDFAAINERFGRVAGDKIVREISGRLRSALRGSDPLARYGGVIFAITLADTALEAARAVAEKLIRSATEGAFLILRRRRCLRGQRRRDRPPPRPDPARRPGAQRRQAGRRRSGDRLGAALRGRRERQLRPSQRNLHRQHGEGLPQHGAAVGHHRRHRGEPAVRSSRRRGRREALQHAQAGSRRPVRSRRAGRLRADPRSPRGDPRSWPPNPATARTEFPTRCR